MQKSLVKSKESEHTGVSEQHKPQPLKDLVNAAKHLVQEARSEHEARVDSREEERRHKEAMHHAEEERVRIENQRAQEELQRDRRREQQHNIDSLAEIAKHAISHVKEQERVLQMSRLQSEFDGKRCQIEVELNKARVEAECHMNGSQFSVAIDKFNLAISKVEILAALWLSLQSKLGHKVKKYDYADVLILQLKEQRKQATTLLDQDNRKLAWEKQRETLLPRYNLILQNVSPLATLNILNQLRSLHAICMQNRNFLNSQDQKFLTNLDISIVKYEMLLQEENRCRILVEQRARNVELQIGAHSKINLAKKKLEIGDIPSALVELTQARHLASRITDFNDIVVQPKTIPTDFDASLQMLNEQKKDFSNRAQLKSQDLVAEIINLALFGWRNSNVTPNLYAQHRVGLHKALVNNFTVHWHKFDRRERDEDLIKKIWELINSRLKIIGWIKWFQDTSKTISIHEFDNCLEQIRIIFNAYVPLLNPEPIYLSIGLQVAQAEDDLIPTAQVVAPFGSATGLKFIQ